LITKKWLEYPLAILGRNARTAVLYRELQFTVERDPRRDAERRARWRIFDRVLEKIHQHALHLLRIHLD